MVRTSSALSQYSSSLLTKSHSLNTLTQWQAIANAYSALAYGKISQFFFTQTAKLAYWQESLIRLCEAHSIRCQEDWGQIRLDSLDVAKKALHLLHYHLQMYERVAGVETNNMPNEPILVATDSAICSTDAAVSHMDLYFICLTNIHKAGLSISSVGNLEHRLEISGHLEDLQTPADFSFLAELTSLESLPAVLQFLLENSKKISTQKHQKQCLRVGCILHYLGSLCKGNPANGLLFCETANSIALLSEILTVWGNSDVVAEQGLRLVRYLCRDCSVKTSENTKFLETVGHKDFAVNFNKIVIELVRRYALRSKGAAFYGFLCIAFLTKSQVLLGELDALNICLEYFRSIGALSGAVSILSNLDMTSAMIRATLLREAPHKNILGVYKELNSGFVIKIIDEQLASMAGFWAIGYLF